MHHLYFVAVPKSHDVTTPLEAMNTAQGVLDENNFCNSEGGYFSASKGDWYEVGGRWSNFLVKKNKWAIEAEKEIQEYLNRPDNLSEEKEPYSIIDTYYGEEKGKKKQKELRAQCELIWARHRPKDYPQVPWDRSYSEEGVFHKNVSAVLDCAEIITQETINYITEKAHDCKKQWDDTLEVFVAEEEYGVDECDILTWFENTKPENIIGKYWICVIDYHS